MEVQGSFLNISCRGGSWALHPSIGGKGRVSGMRVGKARLKQRMKTRNT